LRSDRVTVIDSTVAPFPAGRDDVVVGDHIAVGRDDEAGAERSAAAGSTGPPPAAATIRKPGAEAAEEFLEAGGSCRF
jgi:hypothetical protein